MSGAQSPVRVALLHNIVSPHVVPLFERLANQPGIALKVYFLAETDQNRRWATVLGDRFAYEILPHRAVRVGRADLHTFFVNPTILTALRRDGFDVLVSAGWDSFAALASFALCRATHRPFVLWAGSTAHEPSWRRTLAAPLVRLLVHGSAAWIAYGTRAQDYLVSLGATPGRVFRAFNTVDVKWFASRATALQPERAALRQTLGLGAGPVVLYVGQLIERKGVWDLLRAHRVLSSQQPDAELVLVGYGPLEGAIRAALVKTGQTGVHVVGHVALSDLPRYYVAADTFVLPSHEEVWGLVLNEAAAAGLPLVTTDRVGAGPDLVVESVNGHVYPAGDVDALARALNSALRQRAAFGAASRERVMHFTYDQNVTAMVGAVDAALTWPLRTA